MKKTIRTIAIIALMCMTASGCQKENMVEPQNIVSDVTYKSVYYTVDGVTAHVSFVSEESWNEFIDWMIALAEEGHRVSFRNANHECGLTKEVVTYTTKDHDDAHRWACQMEEAGYEVVIDFNSKTGVYTCTAIK